MLTAAMIAYGVNVYLWNTLKNSGMDPVAAGNVSRWVAMIAAMMGSALLGMLHGVTSIKFRADQVISGTVLNILAVGLTGYLYRQFLAQTCAARPRHFPGVRLAGIIADSLSGTDSVRRPEADRLHDVAADVGAAFRPVLHPMGTAHAFCGGTSEGSRHAGHQRHFAPGTWPSCLAASSPAWEGPGSPWRR